MVACEADAGGPDTVPPYLIAAERLKNLHETVLRYWREDAASGQRFASGPGPRTGRDTCAPMSGGAPVSPVAGRAGLRGPGSPEPEVIQKRIKAVRAPVPVT